MNLLLRVTVTTMMLASLSGSVCRAGDLPPAAMEAVDSFGGQVYLAVKNLKTGETIGYREKEKVQTASVIKVPIMVEVFAQAKEHRLSLNEVVSFTEDNRAQGSGILQDLGLGLHLTIRDLVVLMIVLSDNSATNMLVDRVGIAAVNERMRSIGLPETALFKKVFRPAPTTVTEEQKKWGLGVTTPAEMLLLMEGIYSRKILDAASCDDMIAILKKQRDRDQIPRYLVGRGWEKIEVANKTGALDRVRNDVGIVFAPEGDCILALFAQESGDQKWTPDNQATLTLARLAEIFVSRFRGISK